MSPPVPIKRLGEIVLREPGQSPIEAARQHVTAARQLSDEALRLVLAELGNAAAQCAELADFELLPPGVREVLRQVGEQIEAGCATAQTISARKL